MENLINFEENGTPKKQKHSKKNPVLIHPLLVNDRMSLELNNPFDKLEYRATHLDDPFECLINSKETMIKNETKKEEKASNEGLMDKKSDSKNNSVISIASSTGSKKEITRCQSDSSTVSNNESINMSRFNSVDNIISKKSNQLLKLSLLNSPNSPLHSSSITSSSVNDLDAMKISEKLKNFNELSFEDLNNISQHLIDTSNLSAPDTDLEQLRISFLEKNPVHSVNASPIKLEETKDNMQEKIEILQQKLKQIKKEEPVEHKAETKPELSSPEQKPKLDRTNTAQEVENILQKVQVLVNDNKKDEARKHLQILTDMLGPSESNNLEPPVPQPYIRQDTFEIDQKTGRRKYSTGGGSGDDEKQRDSTELMEQLAKLLGAQSLDVSSLNLSGSNNSLVVIVPKMPSPAATPIKHQSARRSVSLSTQRPGTTNRGIENRKLSTPMKHIAPATSSVARRSSFTAPRPLPKPLEQKTNFGAVRKSLIGSMDKSPMKAPIKSPLKKNAPMVRRSISLKTTIPSVTVSQPTPKKNTSATTGGTPSKNKPRPSTSRLASTPVCRKLAAPANPPARPSTVTSASNYKRPTTTTAQKTEFRTPYGAVSSRVNSNYKGSLV